MRQRRVVIPIVVLGCLLVLADAFLVTAEILRFRGGAPLDWPITFTHWGWRADPDGSFAEIWGYAKAFLAAALLIVLFFRERRAGVLLVTAIGFIAVGLDDMLRLHETGGGRLVGLGVPGGFGMRAQDIGELLIWVAIGIPLAVAWLLTYRRAAEHAKRIARRLVVAFAVLAFFAVGVDMVGSLLVGSLGNNNLTYAMTVVEVSGELLGLTAVVLIPAWALLRHHTRWGRGADVPPQTTEAPGQPTEAPEQAPEAAEQGNEAPQQADEPQGSARLSMTDA